MKDISIHKVIGMPTIVYGGVRYTQVRHAVYCKKCFETIESRHDQDFKYCSCGAIRINGGISDGNRILGNPSDMENRSMYCATVQEKKIWLPLCIIEEHFQKLILKV